MSYVQKLVCGLAFVAALALLPSAAQAHGGCFVRHSHCYPSYYTPCYTTCGYPVYYQQRYTPFVQTVVVKKPVLRVLPTTYVSGNGTRVIIPQIITAAPLSRADEA
jgi:hypothetical protein